MLNKPEFAPIRRTLIALKTQLVCAEEYAKSDNNSKVPSVWQMQNAHLSDYVRQLEIDLDILEKCSL